MARETLRGIHNGVRIRVKRSKTRSADKGTVEGEPYEVQVTGKKRLVVNYRSDRNAGLYTVDARDVSVILGPKVPKNAEPEWAE